LIAGSLPFTIGDVRRDLKGKDFVCWCEPGAPCHGDVLYAVANTEPFQHIDIGANEAFTSLGQQSL
jgi:Domain of unknown function (DUF4326)